MGLPAPLYASASSSSTASSIDARVYVDEHSMCELKQAELHSYTEQAKGRKTAQRCDQEPTLRKGRLRWSENEETNGEIQKD